MWSVWCGGAAGLRFSRPVRFVRILFVLSVPLCLSCVCMVDSCCLALFFSRHRRGGGGGERDCVPPRLLLPSCCCSCYAAVAGVFGLRWFDAFSSVSVRLLDWSCC